MTAMMMPSSVPSSSAAGVLSYLVEDDNTLKVKALTKIYNLLDLHWAEICDSLPLIEELSEDTSFPATDLAAIVASKCFYHLQEYTDALRLALCAGKYLDISVKNEYIETILSKCIDEYKSLRAQQDSDESVVMDPRMENIIEQMFQRCYRDLCFEQAIGVALDTRRLDKVEEVCSQALSAGKEGILGYTFNLCQSARNITPREFRLNVIEVLVANYSKLAVPDYSNVCFGLQYLNRPAEVVMTLDTLLKGSVEDSLLAYQIAFDLQEAENQGFILQIVSNYPGLSGDAASASVSSPPPPAIEGEVTEGSTIAPPIETMTETVPTPPATASIDPVYLERLQKLKRILTEGMDIDLTLNFLFKQSHSDLNVLKELKTATETKGNVLHSALVFAHGIMNAGTTRDNFLRENLDWLGKAKNWAKFSTVGSIGVVHKGNVHESMKLLQPYLPQGGQLSSPYSESGALYALGLIHANKGGVGDSITVRYLTDALRNAGNSEIVQHGACLGIGLAAMATGNDELFETLRAVLFTDSAVAGEGAALGIGLVMIGQSDSLLAQQVLPDLLNYLHDTQHEKIIRALALSIAMMVYGKEESADVIIEQLSRDRDPIVRYGAMFAIGLAYCGTADNNSIKKLLHVAVSDVSDDVRRAAVMCLGFLMFRSPETVPQLVSLLSESFNPHVRYGACMAIGISCAGTALKDAIDLLTPMLEDNIDFVRQGALMSMAMVLQQTAEARSPSVKKFRDLIITIVNDKHQPVLAKSGAIAAAGIMDAGGCNVIITMQSRAGFMKMGGAVGIMMFLQHWYWYPLMNFLSLSFSATMLLGLDGDFNTPSTFEVVCNAPPSMFAYQQIEEKKSDEKKLVATAVLSTTMRAKQREAKKEAKKLGRQSSIDSDGPALEKVTSYLSTTSYLSIENEGKVVEQKPKKVKEPSSYVMTNPSRLIPTQRRFVSLPTTLEANQRYLPVCRRTNPNGIVLLIDQHPELGNPDQMDVETNSTAPAAEAATPTPNAATE